MNRHRIEAVADSSTYIALDLGGLIEKTVLLFNPIHLPVQVRWELRKVRARRDRLKQLAGVVRGCHKYDLAAGRLLVKTARGVRGRDWGEAEAIQQAVELGAILLVDDAWARGMATRMGVRYMGTVGILDRLLEMRIVKQEEAEWAVRRMIDGGIRLPVDELRVRGWL